MSVPSPVGEAAASAAVETGEAPETSEASEASDGFGLQLGHSCHRMLVWEFARIAPSVALELVQLLGGVGYSEQLRSPLVRELVHPEEHSVVIVPRTGRVQIRVHYLTPLEAREAAARKVARELAALAYPSTR